MLAAFRCPQVRRRRNVQRLYATATLPHRRLSSSPPAAGDNGDTPRHAPTPTYLHLGPSGDAWTGPALFAAKHLQPDYVRSLPLPAAALPADRVERLLEGDPALARAVYESGDLTALLERLGDERRG